MDNTGLLLRTSISFLCRPGGLNPRISCYRTGAFTCTATDHSAPVEFNHGHSKTAPVPAGHFNSNTLLNFLISRHRAPAGRRSARVQTPIPARRFWRPTPAQRLPVCTYQKSRLLGGVPAGGFRSAVELSGSLRAQVRTGPRGLAHGVRVLSPGNWLRCIHDSHATPRVRGRPLD
jgi:hypothetical protein